MPVRISSTVIEVIQIAASPCWLSHPMTPAFGANRSQFRDDICIQDDHSVERDRFDLNPQFWDQLTLPQSALGKACGDASS